MKKIFSFYRYLFIIFCLLENIQTIDNFQEIILTNETIYLDSLDLPSYFKIKFDSEYDLPNYIKIKIDIENAAFNNSNLSNCIISYFEADSNFKEKKQMSQSSSGSTFMLLNKEQIKNEFYISIESSKVSENCSLNIYLSETGEIDLNEQYTYYVSEKNQVMNFTIINDNISEVFGNNLITLWAKGNKNIKTILDFENIKHSKYNAYLTYFEEFQKFRFNFTVYGEVGDLINIGSMLFEGDSDPISYIMFKNQETEITGFLKRGFIEKNCFKFEKINTFFSYASYVIYDKAYNFQESNQYNYNLENYDLKCVEFPDNYVGEDLFYSLYYTPIENNKNESKRINKFAPIQINGLSYQKYIKNGENIGIIPVFPDDDFNYLTYYINTIKGKTKIAMYTCENYPLCDIDNINNNEMIPIQNFYSYSISFAKNELKDKLLSNINPQKLMMVISCENKNLLALEEEKNNEYDTCLIESNIFTNKNSLLLNKNFNYHKYIRKDDINKFIIAYEDGSELIYLNIEIFSGEISLNINATEYSKYEEGNKKLFIIQNNDGIGIDISILAETNSVYSINYFIPEFMYMLMAGSNYLLTIPNDIGENEGIILSKFLEPFEEGYPNDLYFYGIYPLNCKIKAELYTISFNTIPINSKYGFYQNIDDKNNNLNNLGFKISKDDNSTDDCLFYISIFKYNNDTKYNDEGIILENNVTQIFALDKNYSVLKYNYIYTERDKNVSIYLTLLNEEKYILNLFINEFEFKSNYEINETEEILIESEDIKDKCQNEQQICKISFSIISKNDLNESFIKINVNTEEIKHDEEEDKEEEHEKEEEKSGEKEEEKTEEKEEEKEHEEEHEKEETKEEEYEKEETKEEEYEKEEKNEEEHKKEEEKEEEENKSDGKNDDDDDDNNTTLIVLIIIGSILLIIIIIIVLLKCKKNSNFNEDIENIQRNDYEKILADKDN